VSPGAEILSLGEALDALASPDAHERFATATGTPLCVVDWPATGEPIVSPDDPRVRLAIERLASLACVTVVSARTPVEGRLSDLRDAFDVHAADAEELARVRGTIHTHPMASTTLVQLLRGSLARSVEEGLVAESLAYSALQAGPEFVRWRAGRERRPVPPDPDEGAVVAHRDDSTLRIELNRPGRHNALSRALRDGLCEALDVALFDPSVEVVEVSGRGPSFCSGGDLDEFGDFPDPTTAHLVRTTRSPARGFARLGARLRVRVHGACLGAGVELPAFAHHVSASPEARFGLPELLLGLVPGAGGTVSLPRRIGRQATAKLALMGGSIDAKAALELGLIDAIEERLAGPNV
jgi:enoyl-CoA hydratase/carnithine racemase